MANSNNTQLPGTGTDSAKRAANDAAYGALYGAVIGANPTGSNQYPNANGSLTQADINALRGMTAQDYLNAFGTAGNSQYPNANSSVGDNTTPNTFQDPNVSGNVENSTDLTDVAKDVINGKYGNAEARRNALIAAGYDPDEVQKIVNGMYSARGGAGGISSENGGYVVPTLPSASSQADYIKAMYDASQKAQEESLRASYEKNTGALDYQQSKIAPTYDAAANNAGAQAAIQRANFNESANASGLNTGAGSQADLSMRNAEAANISAIRKAQADAQADLDYQRSQLTLEYQNAIREAIAKNELQKAQALYEEAKRVDESLVSTAINQANLNWQIWKYNNS